MWLAALAAAGLVLVVVLRSVPRPPRAAHLSDGTAAYFVADTQITPADSYPHPREIHVDGDAFIHVSAAPEPLIVRTRLLILTITGESALRVTAYSRQPGEQVEVLSGQVRAEKSYSSPYREPVTLVGGQMALINRDIDLMEQETFDPATLREWSQRLIASVGQHDR